MLDNDAQAEALHNLITASGLSWDQRAWSWCDVRACLQERGSLGPLRWRYAPRWGCAAHCTLQVIAPPGAPVLLLVTEAEDNPGRSVTNAAALLVSELTAALGLDPREVRFVECYTMPFPEMPAPRFAATTFEYAAQARWSAPQWLHLDLSTVVEVAAALAALPAAARNLDRRARA